MKNLTTPRTLADATFTIGYIRARPSASREIVMYVLWVLFLLVLIGGAHLVATVWG